MKILRDFFCESCQETHEKLIDSDVLVISCSCGKPAYRTIGMPQVKLDGTDPSFPGAYEKWANMREQRAKEHRKKSYYEG